MQSIYRLDWYNASGVLQTQMVGSAQTDSAGERSGFTNLAYVRRVNAPGMTYLTIRGDHEILADLTDNWQVEVWRKPFEGTWRREITGIVDLEKVWSYTDKPLFYMQMRGIMSKLADRHVLWYAGIANRTQFTNVAAETIMKTLVSYNAAANATTANGRLVNGAITGLTVQADGANGNNLYWYNSWANLLETLQGISKVGGGDFDLVKTSSTTYEFRWYTGQLGTDRTATVTFALEYGNMANPVYRERGDEATIAVVGGQGEGADREIATVTGTNYHASTNHKEVFVNATDIDEGDTNGLQTRGEQKLRELQAEQSFDFEVTQSPHRYVTDYDLGDLVNAVNPFKATSHTLKVQAIRVTMDAESETGELVSPEFGIA
jgi:hypothetical protein